MRVTKYSHACVRIEHDGAVLVIDPGSLTEPAAVDGVDAVLITHEHADHVDRGKLADALAKRSSIGVYTHPDVAKQLTEFSEVVHEVLPGEDFTAAGFGVRTFGGLHALIHPDIPRVANLAFLIEGQGGAGAVYHPGDSFDVPVGAEVETLFVPVAAPWLKAAEAVDFVRQVRPRRAYALHDGFLNDAGHGLMTGLMQRLCGAEYARLQPVSDA